MLTALTLLAVKINSLHALLVTIFNIVIKKHPQKQDKWIIHTTTNLTDISIIT